jgi:hypothetical protein
MKSKIPTLFAVVLLSTITVGIAHAAPNETVKANIPFSFYAGSSMMPAGTYSVGFDSLNNVAIIRDDADSHEVFLLAMSSTQGTDTPKLVFDHVGDSYFLRDLDAFETDVSFPVRNAEMKLARSSSGSEVVVAMN